MKRVPFILVGMLLVCMTVGADEMPQQGRRGMVRADWSVRRAQHGQDRGPGGDYFTGEKHQLVVMAEFADQTFSGDEAATMTQWDKILNAKHYDEEPFRGSVRDYFYDQSYGQFTVNFDLTYVKVGAREKYRSTEEDDENSQYLVNDVIDILIARDIDWRLYDWNGDGYVNQLLIIYAGKGSGYGGFGGGDDAIWPHQWWLSEHLKDRQQGVYCEPRTVDYSGQHYMIDSYCAVQELSSKGTYSTFGTLCHEYTHCFGMPDFYNQRMNSTPSQWDLMDTGNYNGNGFCPAGYSAHERWLMGWLTPVELSQTTIVSDMPALADEAVAYLIRNDGYAEEYYMVENRQQKSWDAELPGSGVVVFHIDYDPYLWLTGTVNSSNTQHYMLIKANNKASKAYSSGWAYPYEGNNALTDVTTPSADLWHANTSGSQLLSKPLTKISVTDGLASFVFMETTGIGAVRSDAAGPQKILRNGTVYIVRGERLYTIQGLEIKQ